MTYFSSQAIGDRSVKLMLTGYSAAPEGYDAKAQKFLTDLVEHIGGQNTALVTSPTADKGSIDAIGTLVSQASGASLMYITSADYVGYIAPGKFPTELKSEEYTAKPKYVLPTNAEYSIASAMASNAILVTGGRDTAVQDAVNSILQDNKVVIVEGLSTLPAWDDAKMRVNNAAVYIREQLESLTEAQDLKHEVRGGLTKEFLLANKEKFAFVTEPQAAAQILKNSCASRPAM